MEINKRMTVKALLKSKCYENHVANESPQDLVKMQILIQEVGGVGPENLNF